jgi:phosphopantothenate---cysteine ligase (CTP)
MNILITAGNTSTPIDRVRCITNVFTGRTGARIALEAHKRGHVVTLLTSHPEVIEALRAADSPLPPERLLVRPYRTFDDLERLMAATITTGAPDVVIHCAAVSDYAVNGIYAPAGQTRFNSAQATWDGAGSTPHLADRSAGKVKSDEPELWLRLVRTPKVIDRVRTDWYFKGVLVKFKLEVDVTEPHLLEIAEKSRVQSSADLIVANTLDGMNLWAYLGPLDGKYQRLERHELNTKLLAAAERLATVSSKGKR